MFRQILFNNTHVPQLAVALLGHVLSSYS